MGAGRRAVQGRDRAADTAPRRIEGGGAAAERGRRILNTLFESFLITMTKRSIAKKGDDMASTSTETKVLTAHVPLPLAEKVDQLAAKLERSRGWIVKQALTAWVAQEEERNRLTREALADVDAGRVIDHQAVQAWAESLGTNKPLPVLR